jgi:hypothetical protein
LKESFVGLTENENHLGFLKVITRMPRQFYSKVLWQGFKVSGTDTKKYFEQKGLTSQQIVYLTRYMKRLEIEDENPDNSILSITTIIEKNGVDRALILLADLDTEQAEKYSRTKVRRVHILLKQLLFLNRSEFECAICNRILPTKLLSVAHIKRRSMASK